MLDSNAVVSTEVEFAVQEEDTDGKGKSLGWMGWSYHDTYDEAVAEMQGMKPLEGRLRVVRVTTEELLVPLPESPTGGLRAALRGIVTRLRSLMPNGARTGSEAP